MGYTTDFEGRFEVEPALTQEQVKYLQKFNNTRRMNRDPRVAAILEDPEREAVGLPVGKDGQYFVGSDGFKGQTRDDSVLDYNFPPPDQPGLWCQWTASDDGTAIVWDEGEKFYSYQEWLEYVIEHFLVPWGRTLNGRVLWQGEASDDRGYLIVENNQVRTEVPVAESVLAEGVEAQVHELLDRFEDGDEPKELFYRLRELFPSK